MALTTFVSDVGNVILKFHNRKMFGFKIMPMSHLKIYISLLAYNDFA